LRGARGALVDEVSRCHPTAAAQPQCSPRWLLPFAPACGDDPLAPFQPEITNIADNFEFQATGLTGVTWSQEYVWENSDATANVDHSSAITGGTTLLTIRDHSGTQVYSAALGPSGSVATAAWPARIGASGCS
jgi:hypothetical protein